MPYARSKGATIYYELRGTNAGAPALVMIRGFASSMRTWNGIDHDLAADHAVVLLDNRGTGRSSGPRGAYHVACMADDVAAVMNHAGLDSAHVLGTSLGGMIAQELALRHPGRVRSLVLAATTAGRSRGMPLRRSGVLAIALGVLMPPRVRARLTALATLSPRARRAHPTLVEYCSTNIKNDRTPLAGLIGQAFAIFGHDAVSRLTRISVPTLIIHGDRDRLINNCNAEQLARLIPAARLELWPGVGHDLATEEPARLAASVRRHIQEIAARPSCGYPTLSLIMLGRRLDQLAALATGHTNGR